MIKSGRSKGMSDSLFPKGFGGLVFDLLIQSWQRVRLPVWEIEERQIERRMTNLHYKALKELYKADTEKEWFPTLEEPNYDDEGRDESRTDIRFYALKHGDGSADFTVECKRLNTPTGDKSKKYVDDGMMRFVDERYGRDRNQGAMLGYVEDGNCQSALKKVRTQIVTAKGKLNLIGNGMESAEDLPGAPNNGKSSHCRGGTRFLLLHLLLSAGENQAQRLEG